MLESSFDFTVTDQIWTRGDLDNDEADAAFDMENEDFEDNELDI